MLPDSRTASNTSVFRRILNADIPRILKGEGCWLEDDSGKRYIDACGGAFVSNIGHGVKEIAKAMGDQALRVAYVNGTAFTNDPAEELANELLPLMPEGLSKFYFLSSGSEAVEAALKLARQYWIERGKPGKHKIIARTPGYHGNTILALSASARDHYKKLYGPWLVPVSMIPAPYPYRCACGENPDCPSCSGQALEEAVIKEGPQNIAAFIAETVGGSSTGASVPRPDYYRRIREICDRHEIIFVADEVLCGAGRTGRWTAIERYGVCPDIMTLGKGISGGYAPLSVMAASDKIFKTIAQGSGAFNHAQTFSHTPLICSAGLAAVRLIKERRLIERADAMGRVLQEKLGALKILPGIGDVRGIGMLAGVEFVADKSSKKPFSRQARAAETFAKTARDGGLIIWPNYGHWNGQGDLALIAPPFIIDEAEINEIITRFKSAWLKTMEQIKNTENDP
ncbi:MAG: aminotransferase family protein [Elusimicrobiota bacterium]